MKPLAWQYWLTVGVPELCFIKRTRNLEVGHGRGRKKEGGEGGGGGERGGGERGEEDRGKGRKRKEKAHLLLFSFY